MRHDAGNRCVCWWRLQGGVRIRGRSCFACLCQCGVARDFPGVCGDADATCIRFATMPPRAFWSLATLSSPGPEVAVSLRSCGFAASWLRSSAASTSRHDSCHCRWLSLHADRYFLQKAVCRGAGLIMLFITAGCAAGLDSADADRAARPGVHPLTAPPRRPRQAHALPGGAPPGHARMPPCVCVVPGMRRPTAAEQR